MSQIVKTNDGSYILMCKGAESSIFPRLKIQNDWQENIMNLERIIMNYAKAGLRAIVFA